MGARVRHCMLHRGVDILFVACHTFYPIEGQVVVGCAAQPESCSQRLRALAEQTSDACRVMDVHACACVWSACQCMRGRRVKDHDSGLQFSFHSRLRVVHACMQSDGPGYASGRACRVTDVHATA